MPEPKAKPPPPTEILSTTRRPATAEELTSPQEEFAPMPPVEAPPEPPVEETPPQEPTGQPFEIEEPPPGEPPPEEPPPEEDPQITEAKRKMHEATQEVAQLKKMVHALAAEREFGGMAPQAPQRQGPPPEFFDPEPSQKELADPKFFQVYTQRQLDARDYRRAEVETARDLQKFTQDNPDWGDYYPTMREIAQRNPYAYQQPGSVIDLYERAKERVEFQNLQAKLKEVQDRGVQAGAQTQQTKTSRPFATPRAAAGAGVPQGKGKVPVDFAKWDSDKQLQWMKDNGLYKEDLF